MPMWPSDPVTTLIAQAWHDIPTKASVSFTIVTVAWYQDRGSRPRGKRIGRHHCPAKATNNFSRVLYVSSREKCTNSSQIGHVQATDICKANAVLWQLAQYDTKYGHNSTSIHRWILYAETFSRTTNGVRRSSQPVEFDCDEFSTMLSRDSRASIDWSVELAPKSTYLNIGKTNQINAYEHILTNGQASFNADDYEWNHGKRPNEFNQS